jgi:hypothetical protein
VIIRSRIPALTFTSLTMREGSVRVKHWTSHPHRDLSPDHDCSSSSRRFSPVAAVVGSALKSGWLGFPECL